MLGFEQLRVRLEGMFDILVYQLERIHAVLVELRDIFNDEDYWDGTFTDTTLPDDD